MKKIPFILIAMMVAAPLKADAPAAAPSRLIQKPLVWALGKDPANVAQVEMAILDVLAKHNIPAERFSKLFPQGTPESVSEALATIGAQGCDSLLVIRKRSTIQFSPQKTPSLRSVLAHGSRLLKPKNQVEADDAAPIDVSNAAGNAGWEIVKGEGIVFDLKTEKMIWQGDTQVKSAKDLPLARYFQKVAEKVADSLTAAGLIPPANK
jgi:hypothetical protein